MPPWINKHCVLGLRPENPFVRYARDVGFTVFMISWVNPGPELRAKTFEDLLLEGPLDAIEKAAGEREAAIASLCLGGTLAASALAHLAAKGDDRVADALYMATLADFSEPVERGVFIDDETLGQLDAWIPRVARCLDGARGQARRRRHGGHLQHAAGERLGVVVRVNNHLLGREPVPFDLLSWNADGTALPAAIHSFHLRNFHRDNLLVEPGGTEPAGTSIDLGRIACPEFFIGTRDDHIAPWHSVWKAIARFGGGNRFVLSGSGHIASVVNPPSGGGDGGGKHPHWTDSGTPDPDAWLEAAERRQGVAWRAELSGEQVPAREPGGGALEPLGDAPGEYVLGKA